MTRLPDHRAFTQASEQSWSTRWEQARGTYSEKRVLLEIAAEELRINGETWLFAAAFDAATRPADERAEHLARFEEELEAAEEVKLAAAHCAAMPPERLALLNSGWSA